MYNLRIRILLVETSASCIHRTLSCPQRIYVVNFYTATATENIVTSCGFNLFILDDNTCDGICDHHCVHQGTEAAPETRCVCDRGYYLASDGITCVGNDYGCYY